MWKKIIIKPQFLIFLFVDFISLILRLFDRENISTTLVSHHYNLFQVFSPWCSIYYQVMYFQIITLYHYF